MPPLDLGDIVSKLGVIGLLASALWGFYTGRVRTGKDYDRAVAERDAADLRVERLADVLEALLGVKAKP